MPQTQINYLLVEQYTDSIQIVEVAGLNDILGEPSIFSRARGPLANEYLQMKYYVENFDLVVRLQSSAFFLYFCSKADRLKLTRLPGL